MSPDRSAAGAPKVAVTATTATSALGHGLAAHAQALRDGTTGLRLQGFETVEFTAWLGVAPGVDEVQVPAELTEYDCRNNRLCELALHADGFAQAVARAVQRHGAHRVGVFMGTSTSGILESEQAYRHRGPDGALLTRLQYGPTHDIASIMRYARRRLKLAGPAQVVSTACSSSAKVFGTAQRMLALGLVDAAVVGGVDSLCLTTLYGFRSLELVSPDICRPWDAARNGLSLGEAAAFALLERAGHTTSAPQAWLLGCGETSDGHHMSAPHPEGAGAAAAMRQALAQAGLAPHEVDYLNLHGTATPGNDAAEDQAVCAVFGPHIAASSTKGHTGHTLGAAGGLEAVLALLCMRDGLAPANLHLREPDPQLRLQVLRHTQPRAMGVVASNSFGFGGSNCCLIFGHPQRQPGLTA